MFSRRWTFVVLAGWLLVTGWFVVRDLVPRWYVTEPAPFALAIGDEPRLSLVGVPRPRLVDIPWTLTRTADMAHAGRATTRVQYDQWGDALEYVGEFKLNSTSQRRYGNPWLEVDSRFRVDWEGRILELDVELRVRKEPLLLVQPELIGWLAGSWLPGLTKHMPQWPFLRQKPFPLSTRALTSCVASAWQTALGGAPPGWPSIYRMMGWRHPSGADVQPNLARLFAINGPGQPATARPATDSMLNLYSDIEAAARCRAVVRGGRILPHWRVTGEQRDPVWNPVPLSPRGHVLFLFHPPQRLPGLQAGQRWAVPLIDPEASLALYRDREARVVQAEVTDAEPLLWPQDRRRPQAQAVWLITYRDDDREVGRTWVRKSDALVLRQELAFSGEGYTLERGQER